MKVSKILVPAVALMATNNYVNSNNQVAASCESVCNDGLQACLTGCATTVVVPIFAVGCYSGCGIAYAGCMAVCASLK